MLNKVKSGTALKFTAILLIIVAVSWFAVESQSTSSPKNVAGKTTTTINDPSQWEQPENTLSVSDEGEGNVTLTVEYLKDKSDDQNIVLEVYLNTHSVDLSAVDFNKDIYIEKAGRIIYPVSTIDEGSGHHRSSELTFEQLDFPFRVIGENIGGVKRREVSLDI